MDGTLGLAICMTAGRIALTGLLPGYQFNTTGFRYTAPCAATCRGVAPENYIQQVTLPVGYSAGDSKSPAEYESCPG